MLYQQRHFLEKLGKKLGWYNADDWYKITRKEIEHNRGGKFLTGGKWPQNLLELLNTLYPDHSWKIWKFKHIFWNQLDQSQTKELIQWLGKELRIQNMDDWYRVSWAQIREVVSTDIFKQYPLENLLQETYPNYKWDVSKIQKNHIGNMKESQPKVTSGTYCK
jgi:hypothetical protein